MTARHRLLIHPGFHKTGTSSAQHFLWTNRAVLAPHLTILQLRHLRRAAALCADLARSGNPLALVDLPEALDAALAGHPVDRPLLLSCEGLSGHLPGWPGVADYAAAAQTLSVICGYLAERLPGHAPEVLLTTRDPGDWLRSAWRHHLIGHRMTAAWDSFAASHGAAADLAGTARRIAEAVAPVPVRTLPLEEAAAHPLGPGGALLHRMEPAPGLAARLVPVGHGNRGPDAALSAELLALNRSDLPDTELAEKKRMLCEAAGVGGWARGNVM